MDLLDGIILVLVALALWHGYRVGAIAQLLSMVGILAGIALGFLLIVTIEPHVRGSTAKTIVAIGLVILPASLLGSAGRHVGELVWRGIAHVPVARPVDAGLGSLVAVAGTLTVCWLFASVLVNSEIPSIPAAIERSAIIRVVDGVMPPVPNSFAAVQRYLSTNDFPEVLVNIVPESVGPVTLPSAHFVERAIGSSGPSVVKVIAFGCRDELEGSGFAVSNALVVTNAHVIAGTRSVSVLTSAGQVLSAAPIYFDPSLDLAVLEVSSGDLRPLEMDPNFVERGAPAAVLGFPHGGPFVAGPAGVLSRFLAQGRNIYDSALTNRVVYEIQADVQPGNSGGPLVTSSGEVIGVVFSRSTSEVDIGYAIASPAVDQAVTGVEGHREQPVSTQSCAS